MKTSYMLLALIVLVTLMGMTATNVLLKQQYDKLDWSNPLQGFDERALPDARHWVIEGQHFRGIMIEPGAQAKAFIHPSMTAIYQIRQKGDTVFVGAADTYWEAKAPISLVLRLPDLKSIRGVNSSLTVQKFTLDSLNVLMENSSFSTKELVVRKHYAIDLRQLSSVTLGADNYGALQAVLRDSSSLSLNDTQPGDLQVKASPNSKVELTGKALQWLRKP